MPRGFSEEERSTVEHRLLQEGRRLFERYGLTRTTVEDLTTAAGIAKGSFYRFFASKEELYMRLLEDEEARYKSAVIDAARKESSARGAFRAVVDELFQYARSDSMVMQLRQLGDYAALSRAIGPERLAHHFEEDAEMIEALFHLLESKGARIDVDARVFAGMMRGIAMILLHEDEVGRDVADDSLDLILKYVTDGLFGPEA